MAFCTKFISLKFILLLSANLLFIANCQLSAVESQIKPANETQSKMNDKTADLEDLRWKNRIILVKESGDESLAQLQKSAKEIKDRDIIWFRSNDGKIETNFDGNLSENFVDYLETEYFEKFDENVFLIGKDGSIKSKDEKLDLKYYFGQIDSMPMRQREMRENN